MTFDPEQIVERESLIFHYSGVINVKTHGGRPSFKGRMSLIKDEGEVSYNPEYKETKGLERIVKGNPSELALTSLIDHELNHKGGDSFKGCPRNIDLHAEQILEPVAKVLQELGYPNSPISEGQTLYEYMANLIGDLIDNTELGLKTESIGLTLLYKDDATTAQDQIFPPLFDAFIELQERLYGGRRSAKLLREHRSEEGQVKEVADSIFKRTKLDSCKRRIISRRKKEEKQVFDRKKALC